METVFWWDESVNKRIKPGYIPDIEIECDCVALKKGDSLKIEIENYTDEADVIVEQADIHIRASGCTQYVNLIPDWPESDDKDESEEITK